MSNKPIYTQYHYVYRITNLVTNKHYIGKRSSKLEPILDLGIKYFSSSTDKEFMCEQKSNKSNFKYKVIRVFNSSKEALAFEIKLHHKFDVAKNPNFYNMAKQTSTKFSSYMIGSKHQVGTKNSQYGTMWIYNPITLEKRKIKKDLPLPDGWAVGGSPPKPNDLTEDHIKRGVTVHDLGKARSMLSNRNKGLVKVKEYIDIFNTSSIDTLTDLASFLGCDKANISQILKRYISNHANIFRQGTRKINKNLLPNIIFM